MQDVFIVQRAGSVDGSHLFPRLFIDGGEYLDGNVLRLPLAKEHFTIATLPDTLYQLDSYKENDNLV